MSLAENEIKLHIPDGINYECTGCGKCCGGWAVPMTNDDYERIAPVDWASKLDKLKGRSLFRPLKKSEAAGTPYAYAIKPAPDGYCPFLVNNLCFIHGENGSKFKPSMCQLFPYCFNETPSGIYATVSFVSMGVIYNSGKALAEQRDVLTAKLAEFQALFPNHHPNWSKLQLTVGQPLSWTDYLEMEAVLMRCLKDRSKSIECRFIEGSNYLIESAKAKKLQQTSETEQASRPADLNNRLNFIDRVLLVALQHAYFPVKSVGRGSCDFDLSRFLWHATWGSIYPGLKLAVPQHKYTIDQLISMPWPKDDPETDDLLYRYFHSRLFGKLYFGAGFGQLSLIAGFHHLALLLALIKLQARALAQARQAPAVSFVDVIATIRQLEKHLGETSIGPYAAAALELLLYSPKRIGRILTICQ